MKKLRNNPYSKNQINKLIETFSGILDYREREQIALELSRTNLFNGHDDLSHTPQQIMAKVRHLSEPPKQPVLEYVPAPPREKSNNFWITITQLDDYFNNRVLDWVEEPILLMKVYSGIPTLSTKIEFLALYQAQYLDTSKDYNKALKEAIIDIATYFKVSPKSLKIRGCNIQTENFFK